MIREFLSYVQNYYLLYLTIFIPIMLCIQLKFRAVIHLKDWGLIGLGFLVIDFLKFQLVFSNSAFSDVMYMELPNEFLMGATFSLLILMVLLLKQISYNEAVGQISLVYLVTYFVQNTIPITLAPFFAEVNFFASGVTVILTSVFFYFIFDKTVLYFKNKYHFGKVAKMLPSVLFGFILILNFVMLYFIDKINQNKTTINIVLDDTNIENTGNQAKANLLLDGSFYLLFFVGIMIFMVFIIINNNVKNQKLKFQMEKSQELKVYIQSIELIRDEILSYQHDYDNIFIGLSGLIYNEQFDLSSLKEYYDRSSDQVLKNKGIRVIKLLNMKNIHIHELKGILTHKILLANQKGITIHFEVTDCIEAIQMNVMDLTRCIGILIDNAIEASEKSEQKEVNIAFIKKNQSTIFVIQNTFDLKDVDNSRQDSFLDQEYRHGFGLKNIQSIIRQYKQVQLKTKVVQNYFIQEIYFYEEE